MKVKDAVSANLPVLRDIHGKMGQRELAQHAQVSRRTLARLEAGEIDDPGAELLVRLAGRLGVSLSLLVTGKLRAVTLPLPENLCARLASPDGPALLDAMIRAAR